MRRSRPGRVRELLNEKDKRRESQQRRSGRPRGRQRGKATMSRRITFLGVVRFTDRVLVAGYSPSEADDSLIIKEVNTAVAQRKNT